MAQELADQLGNLTTTENGAIAYNSSLDACLDLFFKVVPGLEEQQLRRLLTDAWAQNPLLALKLIFNIRAVRVGKNDKKNFFRAAQWLCKTHPETLLANLYVVPLLGCWKDLLEIARWYCRDHIGSNITAHPVMKQYRPKTVRMRVHGRWQAVQLSSRAVWRASKRDRIAQRKSYPLEPKRRQAIIDSVLYNQRTRVDAWRKSLRMARLKLAEQSKFFEQLLDTIAQLFADQLKQDLKHMAEGKNFSLAAKWTPSQGGSHDKFTGLNKRIALKVFPMEQFKRDGDTEETYSIHARHKLKKEVLSPLRARTPVTEVKMCAKQWSEIEYEKVHAKCMKLRTSVFQKHDGTRFNDYQAAVKDGKMTITASALLPHKICEAFYKNQSDADKSTANLQWDRYVEDLRKAGTLSSTLAVCDVSGSMSGVPMDVCIAMGLLTATLAQPPFQNIVCTFHAEPRFFRVPNGSLESKINALSGMSWGMNTNMEKVFELILQKAQQTKLAATEMVKRVVIYSDMQFDEATTNSYNESTHERIQRKFTEAGYVMPQIVYWNLRASATGSVPVTKHDSGALLLSGYSGQMLKLLIQGDVESFNRAELMFKSVTGPCYEKLRVVPTTGAFKHISVSTFSEPARMKYIPLFSTKQSRVVPTVLIPRKPLIQQNFAVAPVENVWKKPLSQRVLERPQ